MKVVGLITEYNPFHNGHLYHIKKSKEITGADHVLVIMSGNFVQRGAPAMLPKHIRAEMALKAGASAVIELPVCFSVGSAEYFAAGAVSLLDKLNCIDSICFGSECADIKNLKIIAGITAEEPEYYKSRLQEELKKGLSFPLAKQTALKDCLEDDTLDTILEKPNNILGIEYMKALRLRKSPIKVHTIKRAGAGYHDVSLNEQYSSASAIRRLFPCEEISDILPLLEGQVPSFCIPFWGSAYKKRYPVCTDDFSLILKYRLLTETRASLTRYMDITEDIASRILKHADDFLTFSQFCGQIKTRDMTYTRVSRCLFHIILNMTAEAMLAYKNAGFCQYARILGFRKDCTSLLSHLKKRSEIPLITKLTQTGRLTGTGLKMLLQDIYAADLYESILTDKFKTPFINEYKQQVIAEDSFNGFLQYT